MYELVINSNHFLGAAAASRVYVDALSRLARQAQLGTWGGSKDVGKWKTLSRSTCIEEYKLLITHTQFIRDYIEKSFHFSSHFKF